MVRTLFQHFPQTMFHILLSSVWQRMRRWTGAAHSEHGFAPPPPDFFSRAAAASAAASLRAFRAARLFSRPPSSFPAPASISVFSRLLIRISPQARDAGAGVPEHKTLAKFPLRTEDPALGGPLQNAWTVDAERASALSTLRRLMYA